MIAPTPSFHQSISMRESKPLQTLEETTSNHLLGHRNQPSAVEILDWLEAHAAGIVLQQIPIGRRAKNRAIVQYRDAAGEVKAVGARCIAAAVWRANSTGRASGGKGE